MNEICSKVYYLIATGQVLVITPEMQGTIQELTKSDDMKSYPQLNSYTDEEVDFIELEYGTSSKLLYNAKSYSVDVENKTLNCIYLTQEEIDAINAEDKQTNDINSQILDISDYMSQNTSQIASIQDYILQQELNSLTGGV